MKRMFDWLRWKLFVLRVKLKLAEPKVWEPIYRGSLPEGWCPGDHFKGVEYSEVPMPPGYVRANTHELDRLFLARAARDGYRLNPGLYTREQGANIEARYTALAETLPPGVQEVQETRDDQSLGTEPSSLT